MERLLKLYLPFHESHFSLGSRLQKITVFEMKNNWIDLCFVSESSQDSMTLTGEAEDTAFEVSLRFTLYVWLCFVFWMNSILESSS